ncbi:MAG: hypothetical protein AAF732_02580 [Pseudomonadota bacterium]
MRWLTSFALALATAFVINVPAADIADAGAHKHRAAKKAKRHWVLFRRAPRKRVVHMRKRSHDRWAKRREASRKAHAELRALFARVPREPYVAPKRVRRKHVRRSHSDFWKLFKRVPRKAHVRKRYVWKVRHRSRSKRR